MEGGKRSRQGGRREEKVEGQERGGRERGEERGSSSYLGENVTTLVCSQTYYQFSKLSDIHLVHACKEGSH